MTQVSVITFMSGTSVNSNMSEIIINHIKNTLRQKEVGQEKSVLRYNRT